MEFWYVMLLPVIFGLVVDIIDLIQAKKHKVKLPKENKELIIALSILTAIGIIAFIVTIDSIIKTRQGAGGDSYGWFLLMLAPIDFGISLVILIIAIILTTKIINFKKQIIK